MAPPFSADLAHLVERNLAKVEVAGSIPVIRSIYTWSLPQGNDHAVYGSLAQLGEHLPYKQRVTGSSPVASTIGQCDRFRSALTGYGRVVQLVRTLACHARGRGFEPHLGRHMPL